MREDRTTVLMNRQRMDALCGILIRLYNAQDFIPDGDEATHKMINTEINSVLRDLKDLTIEWKQARDQR